MLYIRRVAAVVGTMSIDSPSEIVGDVCVHGLFGCVAAEVLSGKRGLRALFETHTLRCTSEEHTSGPCVLYGCAPGMKPHYWAASSTEIHSWAIKNVAALLKRPRFEQELERAVAVGGLLRVAAGLWPVIRRTESVTRTRIEALGSDVSVLPLGRKILHRLGIAKAWFPLRILNLDERLYNHALASTSQIIIVTNKIGPCLQGLLQTINTALQPLPVELRLFIVKLSLALAIHTDAYEGAVNAPNTVLHLS